MKPKYRIFVSLLGIMVLCLASFEAWAPNRSVAAASDLPDPPVTEPVGPEGDVQLDLPPQVEQAPEQMNPLPGDSSAPLDEAPALEQPDEPTDPPQPVSSEPATEAIAQAAAATPIEAVVVHSWGGCSSASLIWDSLNTSWASYGTQPIHINYNTAELCSGTVTYAALVASKADVLIISDPVGGPGSLTTAEIADIQKYVNEGHHLIGTYLAFQKDAVDNRGLARLFGLSASVVYSAAAITPTYNFYEPANPLLLSLPMPYASAGYQTSQFPSTGTWPGSALVGARLVGISSDGKSAILSYHGPNYHATYISNMPEYNGGSADKQFFYNAIVYDVLEAVVVRSWGACTSGSQIWNSLNASWPSYGSTPIHIRYAEPTLCDQAITYAKLVASNADVLIISNPSGGTKQYSTAEIQAIQQYAQEGHNLVGTYLLFQYEAYDNRGLASLFGIKGNISYTWPNVTPTYTFNEGNNPLFKHLTAPYASSGYTLSQAPASGEWSATALAGARIVGMNSNRTAVITAFDAGKYRALYISNMVEYNGSGADSQFFYNAVRYAVDAVVVKSWGGCSSVNLIWDSLNSHTNDYGSYPVHILYNYRGLCDGTITYAALANSRADVAIISDPSGAGRVYTTAEIDAVRQYLSEGHHLVGTYAILQYGTADNRGLAPLFGLNGSLNYEAPTITPTYSFLEVASPLLKQLKQPYASVGYPNSQSPAGGTWNASVLPGTRLVAINGDNKAAILSYHAPNYHATYITNMPEFHGNQFDEQFIYNAIVYDVIEAVVVKSFSGCGSSSINFESLNSTWPSYGQAPIHIRYGAPNLCSGTLTYANLVASRADVIIISDPAGGGITFTSPEINALSQFVNEGHNVIGTYLVFQWGGVDNRGLTSLFGLQGGVTYAHNASITPTFNFMEPGNPVFKRLASPYASTGYNETQTPSSGTWSAASLAGARIVGINSTQKAAILVYSAPTYHAIYISTMPEYNSGAIDKQFLYNAILYRYGVVLPIIVK